MFENFKERLQTVQQDFTTGMKTLSDKSKEAKVKPKPRHEHLTQFSAGVELLSRYEDTWVTLHRKAKDCGKAGQTVDGEVVMLSAHWEKRRAAVVELQEQLQQIPGFLTDLETCTNRIAHLEADFEELESRLMYLDNLCGQCEQQRFRHFQVQQLENYKKKKRKELESLKGKNPSKQNIILYSQRDGRDRVLTADGTGVTAS
ncbi:dysbindin-A-like [Salvelinus alpinus]|uniref:dysbindin-A-like n=1 Tax=Salvelinus alpinus TaxID=8036 RepID=UPI0039FD2F61